MLLRMNSHLAVRTMYTDCKSLRLQGFDLPSLCYRERRQFALTIGGKGKRGSNIFRCKVWKLVEQFLLTHSAREVFKNICNRHPSATDTGFPAAFSRFDGYDALIINVGHEPIVS